MISKRRLLRRSRLCVILDDSVLPRSDLERTAKEVISGGCDMLQLRLKNASTKDFIDIARKIKRLAARRSIPVLVNDKVEVALAVDADGLHIGQGDISIRLARKMLGRHKIIGVSANNFKEASAAAAAGADYLGVGPVFNTPIKCSRKRVSDYAIRRAAKLSCPVFFIGGIAEYNVNMLIEKGAERIAAIRAICSSKDPFAATRQMKEAFLI